MPQHIAVIGAGMAGLACAQSLREAGHRVSVFDKGRGLGGRCATRRGDGMAFDHGAQYAIARTPDFKNYLEQAILTANAAHWPVAEKASITGESIYVGSPGMSALAQPLAEGLGIHTSMRISGLNRQGSGWRLDAVDADFDAVVLALPAPQALALLGDHAFAHDIAQASYTPCWAGMMAFETTLDAPDILEPKDGPLEWIARNTSKPGRDAAINDCWVLHTKGTWARENIDRPEDQIASEFYAMFTRAVGAPLLPPMKLMAHRWLYARVEKALQRDCLWDSHTRIGLCGDYCLGPRIEAAFTSGRALGATMAAAL
jgi:renalase